MKRRLVVPGLSLPGEGAAVELHGDDAHYLRDVLRLGPGSELWLFDGRGRRATARLRSLSKHAAVVELGAVEVVSEPRPRVALVPCVSKADKMDLVIRQSTELGVSAIQPVISLRSVSERKGKLDRWRAIARDAVRVSGRAFEPEVFAPIELEDWLAQPRAELSLYFSGEEAVGLRELPSVSFAVPGIELVVGPEGGLAEAETQALRAAGVRPVSLGAFTLRTETAGPVAVALLMFLAGRLGAPGES